MLRDMLSYTYYLSVHNNSELYILDQYLTIEGKKYTATSDYFSL